MADILDLKQKCRGGFSRKTTEKDGLQTIPIHYDGWLWIEPRPLTLNRAAGQPAGSPFYLRGSFLQRGNQHLLRGPIALREKLGEGATNHVLDWTAEWVWGAVEVVVMEVGIGTMWMQDMDGGMRAGRDNEGP